MSIERYFFILPCSLFAIEWTTHEVLNNSLLELIYYLNNTFGTFNILGLVPLIIHELDLK